MAGTRTQTPPNVFSYPKVNIFNRDDFNEALWENAYAVELYEAVACPCKGSSSDSKMNCSNCLGTGWFFINPIKTRALIMSINRTTKFKDWSPEFIGTAGVTFMNVNKLGFMDKIVLENNYGMISEVLTTRINDTVGAEYGKFVFSTYGIVEVRSVFVFNGESNVLLKLAAADYRINTTNDYVLDIKVTNLPSTFNGKVSISYKHKLVYNILDIPHDMRITKEYTNNGKREVREMPVQAIARKAQYELGKASNYEGDNVQDNSYL
jgi:hypothetical protein